MQSAARNNSNNATVEMKASASGNTNVCQREQAGTFYLLAFDTSYA